MTPPDSGSVDVSVLVVSYNTRAMTLDCLASLVRETEGISSEIIVIDNDSRDGSVEAIRAAHPDIRTVALKENLGFGRANNRGAEIARGTRLLLLNPDTLVIDDAVGRLMSFADAHPKARLWGGRTLFADKSLNPTSCWRFMSLTSLFCEATGLAGAFPNSPLLAAERYGGWARDTVREVEIVTGCFLLIDRSLWDELGGFDESFFMYAEEADLCYRARKAGARPLFSPDPAIIHFDGGASPSRLRSAILTYKGKAHFLIRHWTPLRRSLGLMLLKLAVLRRAMADRLTGRRGRAGDLDWAEVWAARGDWSAGYAAPEPPDRTAN